MVNKKKLSAKELAVSFVGACLYKSLFDEAIFLMRSFISSQQNSYLCLFLLGISNNNIRIMIFQIMKNLTGTFSGKAFKVVMLSGFSHYMKGIRELCWHKGKTVNRAMTIYPEKLLHWNDGRQMFTGREKHIGGDANGIFPKGRCIVSMLFAFLYQFFQSRITEAFLLLKMKT